MDKSQIMPNRKEFRASMRKFKHSRVLEKIKTLGAFGKISEYIRDIKKKEALKKAKKTKPIETKQVTEVNLQPIETKEVKASTQPIAIKEVKKDKNETDVANGS